MHKFMYNPLLLEKILDDYWSQKKIYITSVLVKQQIGSKITQKSNTAAMKKNIAGLLVAHSESQVMMK